MIGWSDADCNDVAGACDLAVLAGLFDTTFAGILCVPSTGSSLFDGIADLPGPAAVSMPVTVMIDLPLLGLPLP